MSVDRDGAVTLMLETFDIITLFPSGTVVASYEVSDGDDTIISTVYIFESPVDMIKPGAINGV